MVSGKESIVSGLQRAFSSTKRGTQDPLNRGVGEELRPQESDGQLTYEVMNRDTGTLIYLSFWCYTLNADSNSAYSNRPCARVLL